MSIQGSIVYDNVVNVIIMFQFTPPTGYESWPHGEQQAYVQGLEQARRELAARFTGEE